MKCLVTGAPGFAGSHLVERLVGRGAEVTALAAPGESLRRLEALSSDIEVRTADLRDGPGLRTAAGGAYDTVFHLAALASVPASLDSPAAAFEVNTLGTVNLIEALKADPPGKFLYISSADVYGHVRQAALPIRETERLKPCNPYAASKAAAEIACLQYWRSRAFPAVILRPFNHTGPGQGPGFAPSDFAMAIARIEKGLAPPRLSVGNLESYRDYTDVRDMTAAYELAAERAEPGEIYNISSGRSVQIGSILSGLLGKSTVPIEVVPDPARSRPSDTPIVTGDAAKFTRRTGWKPVVDLDRTLQDLLEWWRRQP